MPLWLCTFGDLMTLLLTFFVMLFSYSSTEEGKLLIIARSFRGAFTTLPGSVYPDQGVELEFPTPDSFTSGQVPTSYPNMKEVQKLQEQLLRAGGGEEVSVEVTNQGVRITFNDSLLFPSGKAETKDESHEFLKIVANTIKMSIAKAVITGHTDDVPISTELFPSNWELSTMRAVEVLRYLHDELRVTVKQMEARGCGPFRPLAKNDTPEGRAKNRRVEIMLTRFTEEANGPKR